MSSHPSDDTHETPRPAKERLSALTFAEEPYSDFNHWMDAELARLVSRWQHLAAPNAQLDRTSRRSGRGDR